MSSSGEVYGMHLMPDCFNTDVLLPNGLILTVPCKREDTLEHVKKHLWKMIDESFARYFGFGDQSSFIFVAVTLDAKLEEFYEESRRLCDLRLFDLTLKLVEPAGNKEEKRLSSMIDLAIGKKINDLYLELPREIKEEVHDFRQRHTDRRDSFTQQIDQGVFYSSYSNMVDIEYKIKIISATYVNVKQVDALFVKVSVYHGTECICQLETNHVEPTNPKWDQWIRFDFRCTDLPRSAKLCLSICVVSRKRRNEKVAIAWGNTTLFDYRGFLKSGRCQLSLWPTPKDSEELLFPLGTLGSNPSHDSPCLLFEFLSFDRNVVFAPERDIYFYAAHSLKQENLGNHSDIVMPPHLCVAPNTMNTNNTCNNYSSIQHVIRERTPSNSCADTRAFIERRLSASSSRRDSVSTTYVEPSLPHTRSRPSSTSAEKYSATSSRTSSTSSILNRIDSKVDTYLRRGSNSTGFYTNTGNQSSPMMPNSPPPVSQQATASPSPSHNQIPARQVDSADSLNNPCQNLSDSDDTSIVDELISGPPYITLERKQRDILWNMRFYCKKQPTSLPKLLDSIDWKRRDQLSQLYVLLDEWQPVSSETALRLLDVKYEDIEVRRHAVKWLDADLDEDQLSCYLLQLVQVLKTEPYLDNSLSDFLINRALLNPAIGNLLFWYLKSECDEMNDFYNTIRFRYLLERYLRGLSERSLTVLVRQVQGLDKIMNLAEHLKERNKDKEAERIKFLQTQIQRVDFADMLQNMPDPTNHNRLLGELVYEECRIMDSAKRPLWLVWTLPIVADGSYPMNPMSDDDLIKYRASIGRRSHSQSTSREYPLSKDFKNASKSIQEEDKEVSPTTPDTTTSGEVHPIDSDPSQISTSSSDVKLSSVGSSMDDKESTQRNNTSSPSTTAARPLIATSAIIFKSGDDLRQDMLTLQIIRIVDSIWRQEGLDMCMLVYTCLSTGKNVGIIEVVNRAETIMSIQRSGGRMAAIQIDSTQLHRWIKERNQGNYAEAIKRFTHSCAGFSVLTFVLGIADRNPDNIMVSEDGRIFHIDFGHFLGHFKKKFGINRERVPFVLTDDFLHVIAHGEDFRKSDDFFKFRQLCGDAYVTLRRHSNLLITLFTMMLRTGIPELRTLNDISYLKTTLQVGFSEQKAREFFQTQFFEAYCGAWATKVDWFFHHMKRH